MTNELGTTVVSFENGFSEENSTYRIARDRFHKSCIEVEENFCIVAVS